MSGVNFLDKLLDGVAVKWKALGELAQIYDGTHQTPKYTSAGIPFVSVQNIKNLYATDTFISSEDFEKYKIRPRKNDLFMTRIGDVGTCAIVEDDEPLAYYVTLALIRANQNIVLPKFILYVIESAIGKAELYKRTLIHAVPMKINLGEIGKIVIPIPCPEDPVKSLYIQAKIVRILDHFSELNNELTSELIARKQQYNYYRDQLLSFKEGEVEWKALGEISEILRGTAISERQTTPGEFPVVGNGPTHNYFHDKSNRSGETVVIARSGAYAGLVSHWNRPIFLTDAFSIHSDKTLLKTRFLYHVLKRDQAKIHYMGQGAGVPHVRAKDFESYKVPVPSLDEQARIVAILDRFDALTNSDSEGLPHEIALRQKQYEYYRDLLLNFPRPETAS